MDTTRRDLLNGIMGGTAAAVAHALLPRRLTAQAADNALTQRLREDLARHASFGGKHSGGPGDVATARWIAERLRRSGYDVDETMFDAPYFVARTTQLRTATASAPVAPQAPVVVTGSGGITAPLVRVETAVGEVRGRIALVVLPFGRHAALFADRGIGATVKRVADAGARAIVMVTNGPSGEAIALNAPEEPFVPVPAAILAPKDARAFLTAADTGAEATLIVDGDATRRPSPNVVGRIERGPRWLVISTPRSGWYGCVAERGTGTAAFLELAEWAMRRFPDLSVFVMNSGGHEYFFAGSHRIVHLAPPPERTLVWTHVGATLAARDAQEVDGRLIMLDTADPQRSLMATESARAAAVQAFSGLSGLSSPTPVRPGAGELSAFTDRGYTTAFAVIGVHRWFHTVEDTLERVDASLVTPVVRAHQQAIELLVSGGARSG